MGQCGIQIGNSFWQTVCSEHDIDLGGNRYGEPEGRYDDVLFQESQSGRFVPRAVLVDLDPSQIESQRVGKYSNLYSPACFFKGTRSAANNWAVGHYTDGAEMVDSILDYARKQAEQCDCIQGF